MAAGGSKHMMIEVDSTTGQVVNVTDKEGNRPKEVDSERIKKIYASPNGFRYLGSILYAQSSPGCVYIFWDGVWWVFSSS